MAKDGIRWRDTPNYTGFKYFIKSIKEERNIFSEEMEKNYFFAFFFAIKY